MSISALSTASQEAQKGLPISRSRAIQSQKPVSSIRFGGQVDTYASESRISDKVYQLFLKAPKNELHVHQGGSSSVEFLSYCLRKALEENNARTIVPFKDRLDALPVFKPDGKVEMVRFRTTYGLPISPDALRKAMDKVLTLENLRNYYRYQLQIDNQRDYMDTEDLAETTAHKRPGQEIISAVESAQMRAQRAQGLEAYRATSGKINPHVKNNPAAYLLANDYAKTLALENVRYSEYRVSPSGNGIGGATGSNIEDVLSAVDQGFRDATHQLRQRTLSFDYGLLVLFERQNRSKAEPTDAKVKRAVQLAKDVVRLKKEGKYNIVGVDLAGDEANNPVSDFKEAFDIIKAYNKTAKPENRLGITIHAGETTHSKSLKGYESIAEAIRIGLDENTPLRIGHGLQVVNSSKALRNAFETYRKFPNDWEKRIDKKALLQASPLLKKIIENGVVLEMCPKSNLQTYGIHPGFPDDQFSVSRAEYSSRAYSRHPAVFLSRLGVKVAISSDNRTISNTDVTNEFVKLFKYAGLTYNDFKTMVMNGFEGAFMANSSKKAAMLDSARKRFKKLEQSPTMLKAIEYMNGGKLDYRARLRLFRKNLLHQIGTYLNAVAEWFSNLWQRLFSRKSA